MTPAPGSHHQQQPLTPALLLLLLSCSLQPSCGLTARLQTASAWLQRDRVLAARPGTAPTPTTIHLPPRAGPGLQKQDFVYVAPCSSHRLAMAHASRFWRKGMRAAFVCDLEHPPQKMKDEAAQ